MGKWFDYLGTNLTLVPEDFDMEYFHIESADEYNYQYGTELTVADIVA